MTTSRGYIGIDRFRIAAAILVVAIHTAALHSVGSLPDFIFSGVIARLGVPFFFAATGFFLLPPYVENRMSEKAPIGRFVIKTAAVYVGCMLLYLPVNIYAGHISGTISVLQILKMILVDGTMYHLWYLPAVIFAVPFVWLMLRYSSLKTATAAALLLYAIGLFGDSYYGSVSSVSFFSSIYRGIFTVSEYTRNGLFCAPVFLIAGVWASKHQAVSRIKSGVCFVIAIAVMTAEGILLHFLRIQRHDSMYAFLPVCIFFLLIWLSTFNGPSNKQLRTVSMLVYIIHPAVIILVRFIAKLIGLERFLIDNSVIHFAAVCVVSFALSTALCALFNALKLQKSDRLCTRRAWVEIDMTALAHNVQVLKSMLQPDCKLMPAIKADAYGFGSVPIAKELYKLGIRDFCVATLAEGIELRRNGVHGNILILGYTHPDDCNLIKRYRLIQTVVDYNHGILLSKKDISLPVHIKIDTGMHRLGERCEQTGKIAELFGMEGLKICGVFTQLSCSDGVSDDDINFSRMQLSNFEDTLQSLRAYGFDIPEQHVQCSYGIINYPDIIADYARPGLALYGIVDKTCCIGTPPDLTPIFTVKARIALVKNVFAGEHIGYGYGFTAERNMRIAAISIGFADGLPRSLSNGIGSVMVHGQIAPIVGNICMDQAMVDVSDIESVESGDEVTVIGNNDVNSVIDFAKRAGTNPNEIVSRLGQRLERIYVR